MTDKRQDVRNVAIIAHVDHRVLGTWIEVTFLRQMGFDYVFDTDFATDLTIMEEASELLDRLKRHLAGDPSVRLPILTSCCPAWVKFIEHQFPELIDVPSTAKSPQQMFGAVAKSYWAEKLGIPREKMVVVSLMPQGKAWIPWFCNPERTRPTPESASPVWWA